MLAIFALILIVVTLAARRSSSAQMAAVAIAVCGLVALLIFLIGDLPDVNNVGTLDDPRQSFIDAEARPVAGFWLELIGSLVLTVCGAALATMQPDDLFQSDAHGGRSHEPPPRSRPRAASSTAAAASPANGRRTEQIASPIGEASALTCVSEPRRE